MRLELTLRSDLAVRMMVHLAGAGRLKAGDLADRLGTTTGFVPQVVGPLVRAGWVTSVPGPTGGYELTADLGDVSLLDVIEAAEGPTHSGRCVVVDRSCDSKEACVVHDAWAEARARLVGRLAGTSLDDVARAGAWPEPSVTAPRRSNP
jgi:Rrf2 family iron-sulfur cluster assembly transcriptional regulator